MNASDLKQYIYENDKVEYVLESIGCIHITSKPKEYRCGLPEDYNFTRVSVKRTEKLSVTVYKSTEAVLRGDIVTLAMDVKQLKFTSAVKLLHEILNIPYSYIDDKKQETKQTPLDIFKKAKGKTRQKFNIADLDVYDESVLGEYIPNLTLEWIREGIVSKTAREFGIMYDYISRRIVIPHYSYLEPDKIVGIIGRTTVPNFELFGIPKYFPLKPYAKGLNVYGLSHNYDGIIKAGYVTVGEGEKFVLKRHSRLDRTCVSIGSHDMTPEQARILMGLDIHEIVIAMDKGIPEHHVWMMCEQFYGIKKVSYIWDEYDILADKESPSDKQDKIYKWLFNHRVTYDESKRVKYKKWLEEHTKK